MKLTINRDILSKALRRCDLKTASTGNPALACVMLSARAVPDLPGGLDLRATNGLLGVATMVACATEGEGDVFINTKQLSTIVNMMPNISLTLEARGDDLLVIGGQRRWKGKTMPLTDAKPLPDMPETAKLKLPAEDFLRAIDRVRFVVPNVGSEFTARRGVFLDLTDSLSAVVIGDHMIAISNGQKPVPGTWKGLLPDLALALAREIALEEEQGSIELCSDAHFIWLQNSSTMLVYPPPPGEYMDWRYQMSRLHAQPVCRLPRLALLESLKALIAACPVEVAGTWVQLSADGALVLDYSHSESGVTFHDTVPVTDITAQDRPTFKINAAYLRDAVDAAGIDPVLNLVGDTHASLTTEEGFLWTSALIQPDPNDRPPGAEPPPGAKPAAAPAKAKSARTPKA